jgi:decaprenylphospho-beta-D-ribofuranose 2-oxidase
MSRVEPQTSANGRGAVATVRGASQRLAGWGRFTTSLTETFRPERVLDVASLATTSGPLLARGLGRAYGDAALNAQGRTVLFERLNRLLAFDAQTGVLECEAGVSLEQLLRVFGPRGFLPPVCPGTQFVTVGGAIACDVHGKNHHQHGSLGHHVLELRLVNAAGETVRCSREENADLFRATIGGMGLTGLILDAKLRLRRVESRYVAVDYDRAPNLDAALRMFEDSDDRYAYSVAWIDCLAGGRALGRSVLMRGNTLPAADAPRPRRERGSRLRVPFDLPGMVLNPLSIRAFNTVFYHRHRPMARGVATADTEFFFPLDSVREWNRIYGRRGFLQYQFVLPTAGGREGLIRILERARGAAGSFLAVLKRFGEAAPEGPLSFPREGYTLALDFPARRPGVLAMLDALDEIVIEHAGRVYLAKDARLRPDAMRAMYPALPEWLDIKRRVDPENRFASDLSRRLGLEA